jgi:hypothetical protein
MIFLQTFSSSVIIVLSCRWLVACSVEFGGCFISYRRRLELNLNFAGLIRIGSSMIHVTQDALWTDSHSNCLVEKTFVSSTRRPGRTPITVSFRNVAEDSELLYLCFAQNTFSTCFHTIYTPRHSAIGGCRDNGITPSQNSLKLHTCSQSSGLFS